MQTINQAIIDNVSAEYINIYLNSKKIKFYDDEQGLDLKYKLEKLFGEDRIDLSDFKNFLFDELFWGKRKLIRVYKLDSLNKVKTSDVWLQNLKEKFNIDSLEYNDILNTIPNEYDELQIAAINSEKDHREQLINLKLLFVKYVRIQENAGMKESVLYFPVEIDFKKKLMYIKTWNRNGLFETNRISELLNYIKTKMSYAFDVNTKVYHSEHKKILYCMSQGLILDIYEKLPAHKEIAKLDSVIGMFEQQVLEQLPLENKQKIDGEYLLPEEVIDFNDELYKLLEKVVVSDYFYDIRYDDIWNMDVDTIISRIRFNDTEHVLTSLSGESSELPIFCTKTFMALKKSMEDAKYVERLWIAKKREKGKLQLKYDGTNDDYLDILILSQIRYTQKDLNVAMEMYESYGKSITTAAKRQSKKNAV